MALYIFPFESSDDITDVTYFNRITQFRVSEPAKPSTGYVDGDTAQYQGHNEYTYTLGNGLWFINVPEIEITPLENGVAQTFRNTLNNDFNAIKVNADNVEGNVEIFKDSLAKVATTSLAADLVTDSDHLFSSESEKEYWNQRAIYIDSSDSIVYDDGSGEPIDITSQLAGLVETVATPTKTSDLIYDDGLLISTSGYQIPRFYYWDTGTKQSITQVTGQFDADHPITYKFSNSGIDSSFVPYIYFSYIDVNLGKLSGTCRTESGGVLFGATEQLTLAEDPTIVVFKASTLT